MPSRRRLQAERSFAEGFGKPVRIGAEAATFETSPAGQGPVGAQVLVAVDYYRREGPRGFARSRRAAGIVPVEFGYGGRRLFICGTGQSDR